MDTNCKGAIAEAYVVARALEMGYNVSKPLVPCAYDLVLEKEGKFTRCQVKYLDNHGAGDYKTVRLRKQRPVRKGLLSYSDKEMDIFLCYIPRVNKIIWVDLEKFGDKNDLYIRLEVDKEYENMHLINEFIW
jgi:hypothetical protein